MKFLRILRTKKVGIAQTIALFVLSLVTLCLGVNEQYAIFIYSFPVFFYFLIRRMNPVVSILPGFLFGFLFGSYAYSWILKFKEPWPFQLAAVFNAAVFMIIFIGGSYLLRKFPKSEFIQIFAVSIIFFLIRLAAHFTPVLPYAKAFITVTNAPTVFDWISPYLGSTIIDISVFASGSFLARAIIHLKKGKLPKVTVAYGLFFALIVVGSGVVPYLNARTESARPHVKVALLQGNFDWSWEDRIANTDVMIDYFVAESRRAQRQGARIIIWPEYAIPRDILHENQAIGERLANLTHELNAVIVLGSLEMVGPLRPNGKWNGYDISLVFDPEKILMEPYRAVFPFTDTVLSGNKPVIFDSKYGSFPVISCFEVANHKFVNDYTRMDQPVDFMIGIANIQIFNGTAGHLRIKNHLRRIAAENGKYFIYVANTGPSIVFNRLGDAVATTQSGTRASLLYNVPKIPENSLYNRYSELPAALLLLTPLAFIVAKNLLKRKRKN